MEEAETPSRLLNDRGHLNRGLLISLNVETMTTTPKTPTEGAQMRHNPTNRPTMGDYCRHIADAAQRHGTITNSNGFMMDEDTAEITLNAIADLAGFIPCISVNDLAALMDVTHEYTSRATTPNAQHTANKAHEALTGLISLYAAVNKIRPELEAMETATANYESQCREAKREQSRQ